MKKFTTLLCSLTAVTVLSIGLIGCNQQPAKKTDTSTKETKTTDSKAPDAKGATTETKETKTSTTDKTK